ncbi:hypothetical protein SBOR_9133 [Sclerotinia borealis F-4128]|uniref:Uncharacterized protein n=1 Tax=Sclerotinia borealis (strain F-4128) TaxID=1432307 RepID=W9C6F0_SCLBF|nr:hypothetical protein SBOR_9133 [Sclerotinia borealis F-4128]
MPTRSNKLTKESPEKAQENQDGSDLGIEFQGTPKSHKLRKIPKMSSARIQSNDHQQEARFAGSIRKEGFTIKESYEIVKTILDSQKGLEKDGHFFYKDYLLLSDCTFEGNSKYPFHSCKEHPFQSRGKRARRMKGSTKDPTCSIQTQSSMSVPDAEGARLPEAEIQFATSTRRMRINGIILITNGRTNSARQIKR